MRLQNHYILNPKKPNAMLDNQVQSLVLSAVPTDRLFLLEGLNVLSENRKAILPTKTVIDAFNVLIKKGFVKLVEGVALCKFVEKLP